MAEAVRIQDADMACLVGERVGSFGAYRDGQELYGRATASKDRQLVSLEGTSHYDLYDQPDAVGKALAKAIPFLKKHVDDRTGPLDVVKRAASAVLEKV